ncbi:hypothetical protein BDK51DRAFT_29241 [Blyttiomyces helicus]|uniref:Uncharacterized protein n=1 Tax=Blyttiomyces helicus TaxID=388810 RepID=A0A4P9WMB6_9FUNG|nr:hypothetical protein BDK51DRAFT_29241 [Blyttiomyces helicus]|eukprot:RKO94209.1 hypothetical protein BDK51DRAFT_29241 [Blyttiomyces helicus]
MRVRPQNLGLNRTVVVRVVSRTFEAAWSKGKVIKKEFNGAAKTYRKEGQSCVRSEALRATREAEHADQNVTSEPRSLPGTSVTRSIVSRNQWDFDRYQGPPRSTTRSSTRGPTVQTRSSTRRMSKPPTRSSTGLSTSSALSFNGSATIIYKEVTITCWIVNRESTPPPTRSSGGGPQPHQLHHPQEGPRCSQDHHQESSGSAMIINRVVNGHQLDRYQESTNAPTRLSTGDPWETAPSLPGRHHGHPPDRQQNLQINRKDNPIVNKDVNSADSFINRKPQLSTQSSTGTRGRLLKTEFKVINSLVIKEFTGAVSIINKVTGNPPDQQQGVQRRSLDLTKEFAIILPIAIKGSKITSSIVNKVVRIISTIINKESMVVSINSKFIVLTVTGQISTGAAVIPERKEKEVPLQNVTWTPTSEGPAHSHPSLLGPRNGPKGDEDWTCR